MIKVRLPQSRRPHAGNQLHDELVAAGLSPSRVFVSAGRTTFLIPGGEAARAREAIAAHVKREPPRPPDRAALLARVRAAQPGTTELRDAVAAALEALL